MTDHLRAGFATLRALAILGLCAVVGALGTTLLSPVAVLGEMLREHDRGLADCKAPAGKFINPQKGCFTFVHIAESRADAIANGAAWSALWYVNAAPVTTARIEFELSTKQRSPPSGAPAKSSLTPACAYVSTVVAGVPGVPT